MKKIIFIAGLIGLLIGLYIGPHLLHLSNESEEVEMIFAVRAQEIVIDPTQTPEPTPEVVEKNIHTGIASYYSRSGCIGCHPQMIMANGQPLDDSALTVAFNRSRLGSKVKITNLRNDQSIVATVTDTGGFERLGRIVDLTVATKDAIGCNDLCNVTVEVIK